MDHSEGHRLGIASNHANVGHWFKRRGKSMDMFRADVVDGLEPDKLYRVQVGAFRERKNAEEMFRQLQAAEYKDAYIKVEYVMAPFYPFG